MGWIKKKMEKFRKLSLKLMTIHITAKFVFGVGLGALLAAYLAQYDWQMIGWALIVISLIMGIPGAYAILKK